MPTLCWCAMALLLAGCAPRSDVLHLRAPASAPADSLGAGPQTAECAAGSALRQARWHLLRAIEARLLDLPAVAQAELDQSLRMLATLQAEGEADSTVAALGDQVEEEYRRLVPHLERFSSDSPLPLLLEGLSEEELEQLGPNAMQLLRLHQVGRRCDVPIDANEKVAATVHFFQTRGRNTLMAWMERAGQYRPMIRQVLREEGLPEDLLYVAMIESGFNPNAYSRAHAVGMWQFIKQTASLEGLRCNHWLDERRDPVKSTRAAARHLRGLHESLQDWRLALAAYNCGKNRVEKAIERAGTRSFWELDLPCETQNYVPLFMAVAAINRDPELFGFEPPTPAAPLAYDEVRLPPDLPYLDLRVAADLLGVSYAELRQLNPELRQRITPPDPGPEGYCLRVPPGSGRGLLERYAGLPPASRPEVYEYVVQPRDNLASIARAFRVDSQLILAANDIADPKRLQPGQRLVIPARGSEQDSPAHEKITYVVRAGESLATIARRHGVRVRDLTQWNGLASTLIHPGDRLTIWRSRRTAAAGAPAVASARSETSSSARVAAQAPAGGTARTHRVARGETLWEISQRYGVSIAQIQRWSGISGTRLQPGQVLVVGEGKAAPGLVYTVVRGDTLYSIARRYGLQVNELARYNNLSPSSTLVVGTRLHLVPPVATSAAD